MATGDIGLIGLAVMGQNLILNMNDKGFNVVAYNRTTSKVDNFLANEAKGTNIQGAHSIEELVSKLKRPRKIILLVKAGQAVDDFIKQLEPHLEAGDIIIDGGNSHYPDSIRRTEELEAKGLLFVGSGVSGGEEGARYGPSLMPGGSTAAWPAIKEIFQKTAAQVNGEPCCDWVGETGSGHYVKMVHNGIEYGDMQLIAEAYDILHRGLGLPDEEIAGIFDTWNKGVLDSFLIDITANILKFKDDDGEAVVNKILDQAGQKGTGKWTAIAALDAGTPVTLIGEAVFARCLSAIKEERVRASQAIAGPQKEPFRGDKQLFIDDLEQALYASKIISYTQGFMLMRETAKEVGWNLNYAGIASMWRGGCIIKSVFLGDITKAYRKDPKLESLLFDDFFNKAVHKAQPGWRRIVAQAVLWGIPTPAFSTALAFFDGYRSAIVPANLLQAQRDYFGAHTFRVLPGKENARFKPGQDIHVNWTGRGGNVSASTYNTGGEESPEGKDFDRLCATLRQSNAERGPDFQASVMERILQGADREDSIELVAEFYGSELRLRGDAPIQQPHQKDGNILCWNGEIFGGLEISAQENDGVKLMEALACVKEPDEVVNVFARVEGPYAFVFYHPPSSRVYFARDPLGRRSLLVHKPTEELPSLLISSVSSGDARLRFEEVSTDWIHCFDLSSFKSLKLGGASNFEAFEKSTLQLSRCGSEPQIPGARYALPPRLNASVPEDDLVKAESLDDIPSHWAKAVDDFDKLLDESTCLQVRDISQTGPSGSARVSVLFSGGIDCTIVAYLAHKHVPPDEAIDLFNVAFENPRKIRAQQAGSLGAFPKRQQKPFEATRAEPSYRVPDRVTGLQELEELKKLCPGRRWNFVEINVPYEEAKNARQRVEVLMLPSRTVMDLSLALALYFASSGKGQIRSDTNTDPTPYESPARVVLSGLGSDELLGGYGRHRTAFKAGGWPAVIEELQLEIDRIPTRNLGRDDRIISSHGKETRHPFLSLDVVSYLAQLPVHLKLDPRMETGKGDKTLLRFLVRKLGLVEASGRKKRAMQFGSHSARMNGEQKGDATLSE